MKFGPKRITSVEDLHTLLDNIVEVHGGADIRGEMYQNVWLRCMGDNILSDGTVLYRCYSDGFQGVTGVNSYKSIEDFPVDFSKLRPGARGSISYFILQGLSLHRATFKNAITYLGSYLSIGFQDVDMHEATFEHLRLGYDCSFRNCDLNSSCWVDVELQGAILARSNFENAKFSKCQFSFEYADSVNLERASFTEVEFDRAYITNTDLSGTHFVNCEFGDQVYIDYKDHRLSRLGFKYLGKGSTLQNARLIKIPCMGADLSRSKFQSAYIRFCDFSDSDLTNVNFGKAEIADCVFENANLTNAKFSRTEIKDSNFQYANLTGVNFGKAEISDSTFESADLKGSKFQGSELKYEVNFRNADLCGADLRTASDQDLPYLRKYNLQGAKYNDSTTFPKGFNPEDYGMVYVEDPNNTSSEDADDVEDFFFSSY